MNEKMSSHVIEYFHANFFFKFTNFPGEEIFVYLE